MSKVWGRIAALAFAFAVADPAHAQVVISQVYGGGGNSGATLRSDFIELHNNGASAVVLDGWSVQYNSATSTTTTWQRTNLSGSIAAGGYYLVKQADGSGGTQSLPTPDATGTTSMAAGAGKVALVNNTTALAVACPSGNVDFVGYGSTANCAEGSAPTATLTATTAALRAAGGCTDSNVNGADFTAVAPSPRNSAAALTMCSVSSLPVLSIADVSGDESQPTQVFTLTLSAPAGAGGVSVDYATSDGTATAGTDYAALSGSVVIPAGASSATITIAVIDDAVTEADETYFVNLSNVTGAVAGDVQGRGTIVNDDVTLTAIYDIQGSGATSPRVGQFVYTVGIVTGRKSNGFFLQSSDGEADLDPATSNGVFVFTGTAPPADAAVGNRVRVGGTVIEFVPSQDPGQLPLTEIGGSPVVALLSTGQSLPSPVALTTTFPDPAGPLDQLERVEGMRVTAASFTVVAATGGFTSEPNATGSSNGLFHVVVSGVARPFREPGIQAPDPAPGGGAIPPIPRWDFNPELLAVDSDALGGAALDLPFDSTISNLVGPLDYGFRRYTLLPLVPSASSVLPGAGSTPRAAPAPASADAFSVAAYNLERFFDTVNDPGIGDPVLTAAALERRFGKASLGIRNFLNTPDILGTLEVENLPLLQALADRINADAVAAGQPDPRYVAYLEEGNDVGGIDIGVLVKTAAVQSGIARIEVQSVTQVGKDTTWIEPDGSTSLLNDRPALAVDAVVQYADGRAFPVSVVVVHNRSLIGAETNDANGDRVRQKRQRQAEFLASYFNARQTSAPGTRLVVLGDFNAFEFNDGLVDSLNVITGTPSPDATTVVPGDGIDLVEPNLLNLGTLAAASERYSFTFGGNAQTLDHVLVNEELVVNADTIVREYARINADFPEIARNDPASPSRLSDHDPVVTYIVPRPRADLDVTVVANATPVNVGQALSFTATLANRGPEAAKAPGIGFAFDAALADLVVTASNPAWNCDAPTIDAGRTTVACNAIAWASGASVDFALSATATQALAGRTVTLAVASDAQSLDPVAANDQASATIQVQAEAPAVALTSKVFVTGISGAAGSSRLYSIQVPAGVRLLNLLTAGGSGNVSLYVSRDVRPTTTAYGYRSVRPGNNETVRVSSPAPGTYYLLVVGESNYAGLSVQARID